MKEDTECSAKQPDQQPAQGTPYTAGEQPPRRVGTATLGVTLIAAGLLLVAKIFFPALRILEILRFAPLVLVLLGVEMLISTARRPGIPLKYDGLSIVVCFLLLCGVGAVSLASYAVSRWGSDNSENRIAAELRDETYQKLSNSSIYDMTAEITLNHDWELAEQPSLTASELTDADRVQGYFTLNEGNFTAQEFAEACSKIMQECRQADLPYNAFRFDTRQSAGQDTNVPSVSYELTVEGPWQRNADLTKLTAEVQQTWEYQGVNYDSQQEMEEATRESAEVIAE